MTAKTLELISMVESLPVDIKVILLEKLLDSMQPSQTEIDTRWSLEAERRVGEIELGEVKTIPGDEIFNEIRERFPR